MRNPIKVLQSHVPLVAAAGLGTVAVPWAMNKLQPMLAGVPLVSTMPKLAAGVAVAAASAALLGGKRPTVAAAISGIALYHAFKGLGAQVAS